MAQWVDWYNNRRLHSSIGDRPPAEHEADYYAKREASVRRVKTKRQSLTENPHRRFKLTSVAA